MQRLEIRIPFTGFYESRYSEAIDHEELQFLEYCDDSDSEFYQGNLPDELRVDLADCLYYCTQYGDSYRALARHYVTAFDSMLGETLGISRTRCLVDWQGKARASRWDSAWLEFGEMTSPREYNFETDRIFATIPLAVVRIMWKLSEAESHATLRRVMEERHSSRSGFISFYSASWADWESKPLPDWDHNELQTLLIAVCEIRGADWDDSEWALYYETTDSERAYSAWDAGVDWPALVERIKSERADKLESWLDDDKPAALAWLAANPALAAEMLPADSDILSDIEESRPYRCPFTLDLFA